MRLRYSSSSWARTHRCLLGGAAIAVAACASEPDRQLLADGTTAAASMRDPAAAASRGAQTITLLTGDRVTLTPGSGPGGVDAVFVEPGPGRNGIGYATVRHGSDVLVLPKDVAPLIASGAVDRALFNVTHLLADGYGDAEMTHVPLLITGDTAAITSGLGASSLIVDRVLPSLHVIAARQSKANPGGALLATRTAAAAAKPGASPKLWLDKKLAPVLDHSVAQTGAPAAHARGFTGAGVTVAVLDSGIDVNHPDLAGVVTAAETFTSDGEGPGDTNGHGTHVASIIAGSGAASGGRYRGVAPDARLISGRICHKRTCFLSSVLAGIEWAAVEQRAPIVNLSLGGGDEPGVDPIEEAVNRLSAEHGTLFVIAAGNDGELGYPVSSPASAEASLAVGAIDSAGRLATFSSRGPTVDRGVIKPDLTAPGVGIVAAQASGLVPIGTPVETGYQRLSGTSMATPHVAGAAALLLQQHPDWTGAELKAALIASADPDPALTADQQGAGRLDIDRATRQQVVPVVPSFDAGFTQWPHVDDPVVTQTLTYRNTAAAPITLVLSARLTTQGGSTPDGMIGVSPAILTIAGGASADTTLTIDTRGEALDGRYSGAVIATTEDQRVVTPVVVEREVESYDLTIRTLDLEGNERPTVAVVSARDPRGVIGLLDVPGTLTVRLPRDHYMVHSLSDEPVFLAYPGLELDRPTVVTLDNRAGRPVELDVPGVPLSFGEITGASWDLTANFAVLMTTPSLLTAHVGPEATQYRSGITASAVPEGSEPIQPPAGMVPEFDGFADPYLFAHHQAGRMLTGWRATVERRQLATVDSSSAGRAPSTFRKFLASVLTDASGNTLVMEMSPTDYFPNVHRTENLYGAGVAWLGESYRFEGLFAVAQLSAVRRYPAGQHHVERYFVPPFGPALPMLGEHAAFRIGDRLQIKPSMFSDRISPSRTSDPGQRGSFRLQRDGVTVAANDRYVFPPSVQVPPGAATYRFDVEHVRGPDNNGELLFDLSTQVAASWTFRSAHQPGDTPVPLTLPTLRFAPELDDDGLAPSQAMILPAVVEWSSAGRTPRVAQVSVDISFDDGKQWSRVPGVLLGDRWFGVVAHPRGAQYASLRGSVRDVSGQTSEVSIVHAYRLEQK